MKPANYRAAAVLFFLPCISVELLTGNTTFATYSNPAVFVTYNLMYGGAVLLIRETTIRWGRGASATLIMAAGYGMINEGLGSKGFFDPHFYAVKEFGLENFGRLFGINIPWATHISLFHAVYSIMIPTMLASALFPGRDRWLGHRTYGALLFIFVALLLFGLKFFPSGVYEPGPMFLIIALILAFIVTSWKLPDIQPAKWPVSPGPVLTFFLGAVWGFLSTGIIPHVVRAKFPVPALYETANVVCFLLFAWFYLKLPESSGRLHVVLAAGLLAPVFAHALSVGLFVPSALVLAVLATAWVVSRRGLVLSTEPNDA